MVNLQTNVRSMLVSKHILMCKTIHIGIEVYVCIYLYYVTDIHKPTFTYT